MKIHPSSSQQGNVLIMALIAIVVMAGFCVVASQETGSTLRMTDRARVYTASVAAAEGALEMAFATWRAAISTNNGAVSTSTVNASLTAPTFTGFSYSKTDGTYTTVPITDQALYVNAVDAYGTPTTSPVAVTTGVAGHPGWVGSRTYNYVGHVQMGQTSKKYPFITGLKRTFQYTEVPLFQSMYFFQDTIEFYRPATMIVGGLVHTNSDAYMSSSSSGTLTFQGNVSYVGDYSEATDPPYANTWSGWASNSEQPLVYSTSKSSQLSQVTALQALGADPQNAIDTTNPNASSFHELIEPPTTTAIDPAAFATRRYYNKAGMIIKINGSSVTVSGPNAAILDGSANAVNSPSTTTFTTAQQNAIKNAIGSRSTIYDQREGKNVNISSLDVAKFKTALTSAGISYNGVLYITDVTSGTTPNAIRLINGGVLPTGGLTVATDNGIYIQGDYNTGTTSSPTAVPSNVSNADNSASPVVSGYTRQPSAVVADAVMLLSNGWSDSNSSKALSSRDASNTTYNTAILSGFMQSGYDPTPSNTTNSDNYGYSGGANNFPRFLENWNGNYCTYYGSMVELYTSKTFTGEWDTGVIFSPPYRRWNYDTNFNTNQPPGSLIATTWSRGVWSKY